MKISLQWISDYVDLPSDLKPEKLAYDLTMTTVEVEAVEKTSAAFDRMVIGRVDEVVPHPNAEKLSVATCSLGPGQTEEVVCGGANLVQGMTVAVALTGATVTPKGGGSPVTIAPTRIRGVESKVMICAAWEIGLGELFPGEKEGDILDLSGLDAPPGTPLAEALNLQDIVLDIDNKSLTNRPDLWGHYGIARELAAIYRLPLKAPPSYDLASLAEADRRVIIDDAECCRRYTATVLKGVQPAESPLWLKSRLFLTGFRPINLPVDLTNYVLMAVGQPSHAFDDTLLGRTISIRKSQPEEKIGLLDGEELTLSDKDLVIADETGPVALAGVMGGDRSSIQEGTDG
ncbi:MAG: phenylalanine--tRNA ligase subunit beta, partial [Verrucomicrobiota bacterium]